MQAKKRNNDNDYSKLIDESIANAEERRRQVLEENKSLTDQDLEELSGGITEDIGHTSGIWTE
jgi:hypothetical protein